MSAQLKVRDVGEGCATEGRKSADLQNAFDLLATAPDGVKRLRELILSLAFRGRLVRQEAADESAEMLAARIAELKSQTSRTSRARRGKEFAPLSEAEYPYPLPDGWKWMRLTDIYQSLPVAEKILASKICEAGRVPVVDQGQRHVAGYTDEVRLVTRLPGPVIVFGDHTTQVKYIDFDFVAGADGVKILRPLLHDERFFFYQLRSYSLSDRGYARHFRVLNEKFYALAPLAEQRRIVARIDELMGLCDALEGNGRLEAGQHARLTSTLFDSLVASESAQALAENRQRIAEHFDLLLDRPEAVDALEKTILELAVRGLLIKQASDSESASDLLDRCSRQRKAYCVENRVTPSQMDPIDRTTPPFSVPPSWLWVRLGSLFLAITDGDHQAPPKSTQGVPFLTIGNISAGSIRFDGCRFVPKDYFDSIAKYRRPRAGDILYTVVGATYGRPVLVDTEQPFCVQRHIAMLKPTAAMERSFLLLLLQSPFIYKQASASITGTAQPTVGLTSLRNFSVPLPPIAEQHRIVARVCELRELCSRLRERLKAKTAIQAQLAETASTSVV